jgi:hypothetical protein
MLFVPALRVGARRKPFTLGESLRRFIKIIYDKNIFLNRQPNKRLQFILDNRK